MTTSSEDLTKRVTDEIRILRKGRGLQVGDLDSRLRPLSENWRRRMTSNTFGAAAT